MKILIKKHMQLILLILFFGLLIYSANTNNPTALIISVALLVVYTLLDAYLILRAREYKATYLIVILEILNATALVLITYYFLNRPEVMDMEYLLNDKKLNLLYSIAIGVINLLVHALKSDKLKKADLSGDSNEETLHRN